MERENITKKNSKCRWVKPISAYEAELLSNGIQLTEEVFGIGVQLKALGNNDNNESEQTTTEQLLESINQENICLDANKEDQYVDQNDCLTEVFSDGTCERVIDMAKSYYKIYNQLTSKYKSSSIINSRHMHLMNKAFFLFCNSQTDKAYEPEGLADSLASSVKSHGFNIVNILPDGNCFFSAVGFQILQILESSSSVSDHPFTNKLKEIGITPQTPLDEIVYILRNEIVSEWLGERRSEYEPFVASSGIAYEEQVRNFLINGFFDNDVGNTMVLAASNLLQIPIVVFTTMENFPVLSAVPSSSIIQDINIYLAYNHIGAGHYDALSSAASSNVSTATQVSTANDVQSRSNSAQSFTSCRCGRGASQKDEFCNSYSSGCKCFREMRECSSCNCKGCNNPYGKKVRNANI